MIDTLYIPFTLALIEHSTMRQLWIEDANTAEIMMTLKLIHSPKLAKRELCI